MGGISLRGLIKSHTRICRSSAVCTVPAPFGVNLGDIGSGAGDGNDSYWTWTTGVDGCVAALVETSLVTKRGGFHCTESRDVCNPHRAAPQCVRATCNVFISATWKILCVYSLSQLDASVSEYISSSHILLIGCWEFIKIVTVGGQNWLKFGGDISWLLYWLKIKNILVFRFIVFILDDI